MITGGTSLCLSKWLSSALIGDLVYVRRGGHYFKVSTSKQSGTRFVSSLNNILETCNIHIHHILMASTVESGVSIASSFEHDSKDLKGRPMNMNRKQRLEEVLRRLGKRKLIWFGLRGADARVLLQVPQFSEIFSITAPFEGASMISEVCLETLEKRRVDLHSHRLDLDVSPGARELHRRLFTALGEPATVLTYRPDSSFTSACFPRFEFVEYLGLFHERHAPFEYKPWVETELKKLGVRTIPWRYYSEYDFPQVAHFLEHGPVVFRSSRSDGGEGLALVRQPGDIDISGQLRQDGFLAVAPYLEPCIPVNVNACVFQDGLVSLHGPSVQLIGVPLCTTHALGYCGNDFAQIRNLESGILDAFEAMAVRVGNWLAHMGYLGAFGIDAVVYEGEVYLTEINPRFQNSSVIATEIDGELGRPDMFLNHMAAFFGMDSPPLMPLRELARCQRSISQIICYNRWPQAVFRSNEKVPEQQGDVDCTSLPAMDIAVVPGGMLFRAVIQDSVTTDGNTLTEEYEVQLQDLIRCLFPPSFL